MVKGVTELSALRDIRTMQSGKKRTITRVQSSAYLDLYMLHKEKDRLEKEIYILDKRRKGVQKRLDEINTETEKIEKEEAIKRETKSGQGTRPTPKKWKVMPLKY